jgi:undecaprenyl pyrophosphate synthase
MRSEEVISNVRVGRPDVKPTAPSHVAGVFQGNRHHRLQRHKGIEEVDGHAVGSARRSTGINAKAHDVIDPRMPRLSPP